MLAPGHGQGDKGNRRGVLPDRLVGNDDLGPFFLAQDLGNGTELSGDDLDGLSAFALLYDISSVLIVEQCLVGRTSKLSPMQRITLNPPSIAALVLRATNY